MLKMAEKIMRFLFQKTNPNLCTDLSIRCDQLYEDIAKLEEVRSSLYKDGKAATEQLTKRRLARQIVFLNKDIARLNVQVIATSQQLNILMAHRHNQEIVEQLRDSQIPSSEDLTESAVDAEAALEDLQDKAELVNQMEQTVKINIGEEEQSILAEMNNEPKQDENKMTGFATPEVDCRDLRGKLDKKEAAAEF